MAEVARSPSPTNSPAGAEYKAFLGLSSGTVSTAGLADNVSKAGQRVKRLLFADNESVSARAPSQPETNPDQPAAKRRCCQNEWVASQAADSCSTNSCSQCCSINSISCSCHSAKAQGQAAAVSATLQTVQERPQQADHLHQGQQPKGLSSPLKLRFKFIKSEAGTTVSWCNATAECNKTSSNSSTCGSAAAGGESSADTRCCESTSPAAVAADNTVPEQQQQQQQQQQCRKASAKRAGLGVVKGRISKPRNSKVASKQPQQVLSNPAVAEQVASAANNLQQQQQQQEPLQDADVHMDTAAAVAVAEAPQGNVYVSHCTVCDKHCTEVDNKAHNCQHCGAHWGLKQLDTARQQRRASKRVITRIMDETRGYVHVVAGDDQNRGLLCLESRVEGEMPPKSRLGLGSRFA